ncbi:MAG: ferredoxin [Pseudomonadota bacterium]
MIGRYWEIERITRAEHLDIFGAFHPVEGDKSPPGIHTLLLLGPHEPGFWDIITASPEWGDGGGDPVDRWSTRVIGALAEKLGATALFPFGGPPYQPFIHWAKRSGRAWASPVDILVHDHAGLMVSYRGALALAEQIVLPPPPNAPPCATCVGQPCRTACPVGALTPAGYNVPHCQRYLTTLPDNRCMSGGCEVRTACPISKRYGRRPGQSAYHMRQFVR